MRRIYLDHTATTPLDPRVFEAMRPYFTEKFGNASSIHSFGQEAKAALERSRDSVAAVLGAQSSEIVFTASGTEADNFALKGAAFSMRQRGKSHIITSKIEHHAVLETCQSLEQSGFQVTYLGVDQHGMVNPATVEEAIRDDTGLISVMHANNEVGTVNPIGEIGRLARARGVLFHTDAVQSFGKIAFDVAGTNADLLSMSAHKIYGPKGIGALFVRKGTRLERLIHGGGQERGRRAGTENVPLSVGFAAAASLAQQERSAEETRLRSLAAQFRDMLRTSHPAVLFNGHGSNCLPNIVNISFDGERVTIDGESLLFNLDLHGVAVTSGSACTSGSMEPSHVLLAMGRDPKTARATLRFSLGRSTTYDDLVQTVHALQEVLHRIARPV